MLPTRAVGDRRLAPVWSTSTARRAATLQRRDSTIRLRFRHPAFWEREKKWGRHHLKQVHFGPGPYSETFLRTCKRNSSCFSTKKKPPNIPSYTWRRLMQNVDRWQIKGKKSLLLLSSVFFLPCFDSTCYLRVKHHSNQPIYPDGRGLFQDDPTPIHKPREFTENENRMLWASSFTFTRSQPI